MKLLLYIILPWETQLWADSARIDSKDSPTTRWITSSTIAYYTSDKWTLINTDGFIDPSKFAASYRISQKEALKFIKFFDFDET